MDLGNGKIKLQVSVSIELCERIDAIAKEIGMDRSQLCAYFIGKQVKQEEAQAAAFSAMASVFPSAIAGALSDAAEKFDNKVDSPDVVP